MNVCDKLYTVVDFSYAKTTYYYLLLLLLLSVFCLTGLLYPAHNRRGH